MDKIKQYNNKVILENLQEQFKLGYWKWEVDSDLVLFSSTAFQLFFPKNKSENPVEISSFLFSPFLINKEKISLLFDPSMYKTETPLIMRFEIEHEEERLMIENISCLMEDASGVKTVLGFLKVISENKIMNNNEEVRRTVSVGVWESDIASKTLCWSDELFEIYGLVPQSIEPSSEFLVEKIIHPEDREKLEEGLKSLYADHRPLKCKYRIVRQNGEVRLLQEQASPLEDSLGRFSKVIGSSIDITDL